MLAPKRVKYRKQQKGRMTGVAGRGAEVSFGDYGLQATQCGWVTARQIEAARVALSRYVKRTGKAVDQGVSRQADYEEAGRDQDGQGQGAGRRMDRRRKAGQGALRDQWACLRRRPVRPFGSQRRSFRCRPEFVMRSE